VIVVVMGVSGSGKSVVGQALASDLGWPFFDADDFHPPENVAKMAAGTPSPMPTVGRGSIAWPRKWVRSTRAAAMRCSRAPRFGRSIATASAARGTSASSSPGDYDTIAARIAARKHAYMPASCWRAKFAALERRRMRSSSAFEDADPGAGREDPGRIAINVGSA
jgi:carbohydrate kinase (thermoresistant glucokinase family)